MESIVISTRLQTKRELFDIKPHEIVGFVVDTAMNGGIGKGYLAYVGDNVNGVFHYLSRICASGLHTVGVVPNASFGIYCDNRNTTVLTALAWFGDSLREVYVFDTLKELFIWLAE